MAHSMLTYRVYFLDRADHIVGTEVIEASSLRGAVHAALTRLQGLPDDQTIELWLAEKRLCSLPPSSYIRRAHNVARARNSKPDIYRDLREVASRLAEMRGIGEAT
jgi:hypothetical protein